MTMRPKPANRGVAFNAILWPLGIGVALIVAFWPLMEEAYARIAWKQIACHVAPPSPLANGVRQFFFTWEGKKYYASRDNMWPAINSDAHETTVEDSGELNGMCYLNGSVPPIAVLNLDAYQHLDQGVGQFVAAGLVLLATAFIAISGSRAKKRAARARPQQSNPPTGP